jgi:serine/threonine-protein kinase
VVNVAETDPFGLVGTILEGQYRVERVVGEGGFGVVYRGFHMTFEQPIAIKALKIPALDVATQNSILAKFREEARLLYVLSQASLNVVRSIGFGAVNPPRGGWMPFVVLEWLEGRSLAADLAERRAGGKGGRSLAETMALMEPAARGLIAAHHQRVVHRDVKPANFFLTKTGDVPPVPTMKVLDFGIAKVLLDNAAAQPATAFVSFTPFYAAPEQLDTRLGAVGLHTDVYSFALILVEVLSGRLPVDGQEMIALLREATDPARRPTPRARGVGVAEGVESVFARALSIDPRARHADLEQFWEALTKAVAAANPTGTIAIPSTQVARHVRVPTQPMPASAPPPRPMQPSFATPPPMTVPVGLAGPAPHLLGAVRQTPVPQTPPQPPGGSQPPQPYAHPSHPPAWTSQMPTTPAAWRANSPSRDGVHPVAWVVIALAGAFFLIFLAILLLRPP